MNRRFCGMGRRLVYAMAVLFVFPVLTGAEGDGCARGGDVPVGSNGDSGLCGHSACDGLGRTLEAKLCPDGSGVGRTVCAPRGDGTCFWDFPECPIAEAGAACSLAACANVPQKDDAKVCPDGTSLARTICARRADGVCDWDFPPCGGETDAGQDAPVCIQEDCAGQPADTDLKVCPDGTAVSRSACAPNAMGGCSWDFPACPK